MLVDERVRSDLAVETRFSDLRVLAETDSTNRVVAEAAAAGAAEGLVVVADFQTAGRGRLDRSWEAAPGDGLLVSILLKPQHLPPERWHLVTAATALAAQTACEIESGIRPAIKWPNDLLIEDRKLAGILAESGSGAVVVGMGLNVHAGPPGSAVLDQEAGRSVSRAKLLVSWLRALDGLLGNWEEVAGQYRARCSTLGRDVTVEQIGGATLEGRAVAVDQGGRLVVRTAGGSELAVSVGDVTHVRPSGGSW